MHEEDHENAKSVASELKPRSNYWWDTAYEVGLATLIVIAGVVLTALGEASGLEELEEIQWWKGVGFAALVAAANFIRSKLPERGEQ